MIPALAAAIWLQIPAGPLDLTLNTIATEARVGFIYDSYLIQGVEAPGLRGYYDPIELMRSLIAPFCLVLERYNDRSLAILPQGMPCRIVPVEGGSCLPLLDPEALARWPSCPPSSKLSITSHLHR